MLSTNASEFPIPNDKPDDPVPLDELEKIVPLGNLLKIVTNAIRRKDCQDAQDAFDYVWDKLSDELWRKHLRGELNMKTVHGLAKTIASRRTIDWCRKPGPVLLPLFDTVAAATPAEITGDVEAKIQREWQRLLLRAALSRLKVEDTLLVALYVLKGSIQDIELTTATIGRLFGLNDSAVRQQFSRLMRTLREQVAE